MRNEMSSVVFGFLSENLYFDTSHTELGEISSRNVRVEAQTFDYQLYIPPEIKNREKLPVIVFLHGIRERGSGGVVPSNEMIRNFIKQYLKQIPAFVLLPQCRPNKYWSDAAMEKMVIGALDDVVEEFDTDESRLSLVGVSMGGYGVLHLASQYPGKFAALISICGGSPILDGERFAPVAEKVGKTSGWFFHGVEDKIVPVSESREMVKALKEKGGNIKYSEFSGVGHNVWLNVLSEKELIPWVLNQRLTVKSS